MTGRTLDVTAARVDEISDAVCRGEMVGGHEAVQLLAYIRKIQRAITVDTRGRIDFGPEPVDPDRIAALLVDGKWVDAEVVRRAARHLGMVDQIIAQGQREEIARLKRLVKMALLEGVAICTHREDLTEPWENGERAWNGSKALEEVNMAIGTKK